MTRKQAVDSIDNMARRADKIMFDLAGRVQYEYAGRHLHDWFPRLPGDVAYVQHLNRVADVLRLY
ncbi:hypothetical protein [Nitrosomonas sp. Nm34]|uniref:hypothetical protein n=1 Tax=Nitrosomonas sp. Nm34 TaxID=1881055 RepID=UPI0008E2FE7D|nr:hypothetical protein [Nitrosomonas sp. Nm34]SFI27704.1 hypothetical protein SAMN05428978_100434 [Nitrosomonas sp. Nm34]